MPYTQNKVSQVETRAKKNKKKTLNLHSVSFTYVDQAKVVLIDWKLLRSNLFLQCRGIGALQNAHNPKNIMNVRLLLLLLLHTGAVYLSVNIAKLAAAACGIFKIICRWNKTTK